MTPAEVNPSQGPSLSQLRRGHPTDSTLDALLSVLARELDLCARLPVFEYEASTEGHEDCARLLRALADAERANVEDVLAALQRYLDERQKQRQRETRPAS